MIAHDKKEGEPDFYRIVAIWFSFSLFPFWSVLQYALQHMIRKRGKPDFFRIVAIWLWENKWSMFSGPFRHCPLMDLIGRGGQSIKLIIWTSNCWLMMAWTARALSPLTAPWNPSKSLLAGDKSISFKCSRCGDNLSYTGSLKELWLRTCFDALD